MLSVFATSLQYISTNVTNTQGVNPTSDTVQFAFLGPVSNSSTAVEQVPTSGTTWYTGAWSSTSPVSNTTDSYQAWVLVGPSGTVTLTSGTYLMLVKVTASPEAPVIFCGPVAVT